MEIGDRETVNIRENGYIYTLVEGKDRTRKGAEGNPVPQPAFKGYTNYALHSCTKAIEEAA